MVHGRPDCVWRDRPAQHGFLRSGWRRWLTAISMQLEVVLGAVRAVAYRVATLSSTNQTQTAPYLAEMSYNSRLRQQRQLFWLPGGVQLRHIQYWSNCSAVLAVNRLRPEIEPILRQVLPDSSRLFVLCRYYVAEAEGEACWWAKPEAPLNLLR